MQGPSPSEDSRRKRASPLVVAWAVVLGLTLVAAGIVFLAPWQGPRTGTGTTIALPPTEEPEIETAEAAAEEAPDEAAVALGPPKIAIVVTGLGLSKERSEQAIEQLPPPIALSFSPYAEELGDWTARAQAKGHEVLIDLPMEPATFPNDDPGPRALSTQLEPAQNLERLRWILERSQGYVGVAAIMGSRFVTSEAAMLPVLQELRARGIMYLDNRSSEASVVGRLAEQLELPHAVSDRALDEPELNREALDARLAQIERLALSHGFSIAMTQPYPLTLQRLADWAISLEARGFTLAPVTSLVGLQRLP